MDRHVGRTRMTYNVRERFLKNAEKRRRHVRRQNRLVQVGADIAFDARAGLELVRLPFERVLLR